VIATDPSHDLALLKISPSGLTLHPLSLANSSATQVGDPAYAIGNPFGLNWTLTTGVVSAVNRQIKAPDEATISHVIQTDAALNPGNSGGPLINASGAVIGVNSQIASASTSGGQGGSTGVGFAISSNTVKTFLQGAHAGI
jgi:putative serine protease PepD